MVLTKKTTNFDAAASADAGSVAAAGDWFFDDNVGGNGVLTYYNEETTGITSLTITGTGWVAGAPGGAGAATLTITL